MTSTKSKKHHDHHHHHHRESSHVTAISDSIASGVTGMEVETRINTTVKKKPSLLKLVCQNTISEGIGAGKKTCQIIHLLDLAEYAMPDNSSDEDDWNHAVLFMDLKTKAHRLMKEHVYALHFQGPAWVPPESILLLYHVDSAHDKILVDSPKDLKLLMRICEEQAIKIYACNRYEYEDD
jgi:hypothetical protein